MRESKPASKSQMDLLKPTLSSHIPSINIGKQDLVVKKESTEDILMPMRRNQAIGDIASVLQSDLSMNTEKGSRSTPIEDSSVEGDSELGSCESDDDYSCGIAESVNDERKVSCN